jgi:DNA repair exonuclease SbcCD nuclease subunit
MLKFLHAADVHLDSPLRGLERYPGAPVEEIRAATRRAFENLVALAVEEEVGFVLLAGDLYDGDWKDYNTGLFFAAQMARLEEAGIRAFLIAGNHDAASQITRVLRPPANVKVFSTKRPETEILEDLGVAIHGQGFAQISVSEDLSAGYPRAVPHLFNIGMLHTSLDGRPGHASYAPCTVDGLRSRGYLIEEPENACIRWPFKLPLKSCPNRLSTGRSCVRRIRRSFSPTRFWSKPWSSVGHRKVMPSSAADRSSRSFWSGGGG